MGQRSSTEYSFGLTDAFYPCPDIGGAACLSVRASHAGKSNDRMITQLSPAPGRRRTHFFRTWLLQTTNRPIAYIILPSSMTLIDLFKVI